MCGIAGVWKFNGKVELNEIKTFTDSMSHRGPDGSGYEIFEEDNIALGHRRLSILDLSDAAKQPMTYSDGRYWLTFNGEVYNFLEIRKELESKNFKFRSESDSEVILASYEAWGTDCFRKFNGMWAIGIWDKKEKQLLLCRDRFGVKPLHYSYIPQKHFAFASETSAFKKLHGFQRAFDTDNLIRAMHEHNVLEPAGHTIYKNIRQLFPGSYMIVKKNQEPKSVRWWYTLDHLQKVSESFEEQKKQFLNLFENACRIRLRSDVPVASALSGGIDSTSVYCMLSHLMKNGDHSRFPHDWQKAFSITFPGSQVDESKYIQSVLSQTQGEGIITAAKNDDLMNELVQSSSMGDFISGTPLPCLTYVYKAMHENRIVVSMDGHGADEYLYGYSTSVVKALVQAYLSANNKYASTLENTLQEMNFGERGKSLIASAKLQADKLKGEKERGIRSALKSLLGGDTSSYRLPAFSKDDFFSREVSSTISCKETGNYYKKSGNVGEQQLLEEFHYIDLPYNLRDFDRGAMQHQVEIRMPFMDYRLVTFAMSLPQESKLNNGFTKYILRESMKGIMPEDIRTRKLKIGLGAPLADWFNGPLNTFLLELSVGKKLRETDFLNVNNISQVIKNNCMGKSWNDSNAQAVWPVINYLLLEEN